MSGTVGPSQVQSIWRFAHSTGSSRFKTLCVPGDSVCWIAPGCVAARSSSRSSLIPSFEHCSLPSSCVSRKCCRLRLYVVPYCAVRMMMLYDLGVLALFVTLARSHVFRVGFSTRTVCCGDRGARSLAVRSWYDLFPRCCCCRNAFTYPFDRRDDPAFIFDFYRLPLRNSHGDIKLWLIRVVLIDAQHRQVRSSPPFFA